MASQVLGQDTTYPNEYDPDLLHAIARSESRSAFINAALPFDGVDIWNAWELTWLGEGNRPLAATAEIRIPATSPNLIESKSLKLYLGSFAMSRYADADAVQSTIATDLARAAGLPVDVRLTCSTDTLPLTVSQLPGQCIDALSVQCAFDGVDADLLCADPAHVVEESLHTHLLRSLCPVTSQPDIGSLGIHYRGPKISAESLLQYVVSFREHNDFHEACVERMFVDLQHKCAPQRLTLQARYQRRGGIDINPVRSNADVEIGNLRLWRQ